MVYGHVRRSAHTQTKPRNLTRLVMASITLIFQQVGLPLGLNCIATEVRSDELRIAVLNRIIEWNCIHHAIHSSYNCVRINLTRCASRVQI